MAGPKPTSEQIAQVSALVGEYIAGQRERFSPQAAPLAAAQRAARVSFFLPQVLDSVRVLVLHGLRVENPPFYPVLAGMGFANLPEFSAITFCDAVVSHVPFTDGLLFHELIHVEQYRQLGIPRFSELYVRGFLRAAATMASRWRQTPTPLAASSRPILTSDSPWPMRWHGGSGREGSRAIHVDLPSPPPTGRPARSGRIMSQFQKDWQGAEREWGVHWEGADLRNKRQLPAGARLVSPH